jgi:hypothetical protein
MPSSFGDFEPLEGSLALAVCSDPEPEGASPVSGSAGDVGCGVLAALEESWASVLDCSMGSGGTNCVVGFGRTSVALPDEFVFLPLRVIIRTGTGEPSESANGPNNESGTISSISELNSAQRA